LATLAEPFVVELESAPGDPDSVPVRLSAFLPEGFEVVSFEHRDTYALPVPETMTYRLVADGDLDLLRQAADRWGKEPLPDVEDGRGRPVHTSEEVTDLRLDGDDLLLSARVNNAGNTVSAYALMSGATGLSLDALRRRELVKQP
jgi:hypothetical protein